MTCIERAASSAAGTPGGMGSPSAGPPFDSGSPIAARLSRLVRPRSIAVVGGREAGGSSSSATGWGSPAPCGRCIRSAPRWRGRPAFRIRLRAARPAGRRLRRVNRHATVEVVGVLSRMGAGGAVCYASGFLEAGDGGALQRALVEAAGEMPIIGPNCYGLINFLDGAPLWPDQHGGRRLGADRARGRHRHPVLEHRDQHDHAAPCASHRLRGHRRQPGPARGSRASPRPFSKTSG